MMSSESNTKKVSSSISKGPLRTPKRILFCGRRENVIMSQRSVNAAIRHWAFKCCQSTTFEMHREPLICSNLSRQSMFSLEQSSSRFWPIEFRVRWVRPNYSLILVTHLLIYVVSLCIACSWVSLFLLPFFFLLFGLFEFRSFVCVCVRGIFVFCSIQTNGVQLIQYIIKESDQN